MWRKGTPFSHLKFQKKSAHSPNKIKELNGTLCWGLYLLASQTNVFEPHDSLLASSRLSHPFHFTWCMKPPSFSYVYVMLGTNYVRSMFGLLSMYFRSSVFAFKALMFSTSSTTSVLWKLFGCLILHCIYILAKSLKIEMSALRKRVELMGKCGKL